MGRIRLEPGLISVANQSRTSCLNKLLANLIKHVCLLQELKDPVTGCNQLVSNWTTNQFVLQLDFDLAQHWSTRTDVFMKLSSWQMVTMDWLVEIVVGDIHGTTKSMTLCNELFQVLWFSQLKNQWVYVRIESVLIAS